MEAGMLTGWIRSGSVSGSPYHLPPPLGGTGGICRSFDLDLLQRFTREGIFGKHFIRDSFWILLTDFEGSLDSVWIERTEVRLEDARVLNEYGSPGSDQSVQSVEEDEGYGHVTWSAESDKGDDY